MLFPISCVLFFYDIKHCLSSYRNLDKNYNNKIDKVDKGVNWTISCWLEEGGGSEYISLKSHNG